jgi:hypothetical protein
MRVVPCPNQAYFRAQGRRPKGCLMEQSGNMTPGPISRPLVVTAAGVAGLALAATLGLWVYYGTAVFYEMIASGIAGCF